MIAIKSRNSEKRVWIVGCISKVALAVASKTLRKPKEGKKTHITESRLLSSVRSSLSLSLSRWTGKVLFEQAPTPKLLAFDLSF